MKTIEKRFPAKISMEEMTFLNDKNISGELYAFYLSYSVADVEKKITIVDKKSLPKQDIICEIIGIKSPKTYRKYRDYLIKTGYLVVDGDRYILPKKEDVYFMIPLKTLQFLNDVLKE